MSTAAAELETWPLYKWGVVVAVLFGLQCGLIFWLSAKPPRQPSSPQPPGIQISVPDGAADGLPGAVNPILFARPNTRGFSRRAWLEVPTVRYSPDELTEPSRLLAFTNAVAGGALSDLAALPPSPPFEVAAKPPPDLGPTTYFPATDLLAGESTLTIEGPLANRPLRSAPELPPQPADSLLTNTIVQIQVNADGRVSVPPVMLKTCGSKDADQTALTVAKGLQFQPLPRRVPGMPDAPPPGPVSGRLIFRWRTVPPISSNAPAAPAAGPPS